MRDFGNLELALQLCGQSFRSEATGERWWTAYGAGSGRLEAAAGARRAPRRGSCGLVVALGWARHTRRWGETMGERTVLVGRDEGVTTLTLNRPDKLNSLNEAMHGELRSALEGCTADAGCRAVLLT